MVRGRWIVVLVGVTGCVRDLALDDLDRSTRDGFAQIGQTERVRVYSSPAFTGDGEAVAAAADAELASLFERYGGTQRRQAALYFHAAAAWPSNVEQYHGVAHCDDLSADLIADGARPPTFAIDHELAHLAACDTVGANARPLLEEGLATASTGGYGVLRADGDWSLRALFVGNEFKAQVSPTAYDVGASFVTFAVERIGLPAYLARVHGPAAYGTTDEVEPILERELGGGFLAIECELRARLAGVTCTCLPDGSCAP
ncbi:MAG TPA: hypothetical protein VFQ53_42750 [Kofleriaceae bacterium]|nr:hypothetical protein [Kofleriaceae bacterium]